MNLKEATQALREGKRVLDVFARECFLVSNGKLVCQISHRRTAYEEPFIFDGFTVVEATPTKEET